MAEKSAIVTDDWGQAFSLRGLPRHALSREETYA